MGENKINSKETLKSLFMKRYDSDIELYKDISEASNVGAPMFNDDDIYETKHPLHRLLRFFFIKKKITAHRLKTASFNYDKFMLIDSVQISNTNWTNIIKILKNGQYKNGLSYTKFVHILSNVLGYVITDVQVTVENVVTKEETTISLKEIEKYLKDKDK